MPNPILNKILHLLSKYIMRFDIKIIIPTIIVVFFSAINLVLILLANGFIENSTSSINIAGRQRMLVQKITAHTLEFALTSANDPYGNSVSKSEVKKKAQDAVEIFQISLDALIKGAEAPMTLSKNGAKEVMQKPNEAVLSALMDVNRQWKPFSAKINKILESNTIETEDLVFLTSEHDPLVVTMNKVVGLIQGNTQSSFSATVNSILTTNVLILCMLLFTIYVIRNSSKLIDGIVDQLFEMMRQLRAGSSETSSAVGDLAQRTATRSQDIEHINEQLLVVLKEANNNLKDTATANTNVSNTQGMVIKGQQNMEGMVAVMNKLEDSAKQSASIIKAIDEIAFQTNLLALNAAVEAARAGEAGAGFAVVAEEVRNLALRASEAAKQSGEIMDAMQAYSNDGVSASEMVNTVFHDIVENINEMTSIVESVNNSSKSQNGELDGISNSINSMSQYFSSNATLAEQASSASSSINHEIDNLYSTTVDLLRFLKGDSAISNLKS